MCNSVNQFTIDNIAIKTGYSSVYKWWCYLSKPEKYALISTDCEITKDNFSSIDLDSLEWKDKKVFVLPDNEHYETVGVRQAPMPELVNEPEGYYAAKSNIL